MINDCSKVVESYLLYQNPFYSFSLPISLIIAIIVYGICVSMRCTSNSYMLQIIIPIITMIIVNGIIEFVARLMLNKNEINDLTKTCVQYLEQAEHFDNTKTLENKEENKDNKEKVFTDTESIHSPLKVTDNLYNSTYEIINKDLRPYSLPYNGLNSKSNCSIA